MGSVPVSLIYFSTSRLSNTWLDTGDSTGCSGTSWETTAIKKETMINDNLYSMHPMKNSRFYVAKETFPHVFYSLEQISAIIYDLDHAHDHTHICVNMLSRYVKEHQEKQSNVKETQEKKRKAAVQSVQRCTVSMVNCLNDGVEQAYDNQRKLDKEAKSLQHHSAKYVRQTTQWLSLVEGFHKSLKNLGDLEQWACTIESDMQTVSDTLEYAYQGSGKVHVVSDK